MRITESVELKEDETWITIPGFYGRYEASNHGRVKTLSSDSRILKPQDNGAGYLFVRLCKDGKKHNCYIHRLVMLTFFGPSDLTVNHKNGIKSDNRLSNLEYCTQGQNNQHSIDVLGQGRGESNYRSILTEKNVLAIRRDLLAGEKQASIAAKYGVTRQAITDISIGRNWKWLS